VPSSHGATPCIVSSGIARTCIPSTHTLSLSLSHNCTCTRMHAHTHIHTHTLSPGSHGANPPLSHFPPLHLQRPLRECGHASDEKPLELAGRLTIYLSKWSPPQGRCLSTRYLSCPLLSSQSITLGNSLCLCSLPGRDFLRIVNAAYHSLFKDPSVMGFACATPPQEGITCENPKSTRPDPKAKLQPNCEDEDSPV